MSNNAACYTRYLNYAEALRMMAHEENDRRDVRELLLAAASSYDVLAASAFLTIEVNRHLNHRPGLQEF